MEEYFKEQSETATPLTEEMIDKMKGKVDGFGNKKVPGDKELFCMIQTELTEEDTEFPGRHLNIEIVKILERTLPEFEEKYEYVRSGAGTLHVFKLKEER